MNRRSIRARGDGSQPDLMYSKSMVSSLRKQAAKKFVEYWTFNRPGSEKSGCQQFWNMLLGELLGMGDLASGIRCEVPIQVSAAPSTKHWPSEATQPKAYELSTKFLDAWIPSTHVLIEQKSRGVKLDPLFLNDLERRFEEIVGGHAGRMTLPLDGDSVVSDGRDARPARPSLSKEQHKKLLELQDWSTLLRRTGQVPEVRFNYIIGNPPFRGARQMGVEDEDGSSQKADIAALFDGWKNIGNLDYVMCWHKKAADYMNANGRTTRDAFEIRPQLFDQHCVQCLPLAG